MKTYDASSVWAAEELFVPIPLADRTQLYSTNLDHQIYLVNNNGVFDGRD